MPFAHARLIRALGAFLSVTIFPLQSRQALKEFMNVPSIINLNVSRNNSSPASYTVRLLLRMLYEISALIVLFLGIPLLYFILSLHPLFWIGVPPYVKALLALFTRLRRTARRYSAMRYTTVDAQQRVLEDKRPPILYLRSFLEEMPEDPLRSDLRTDEELLDLVLKEVGPMVTCGRPNEDLPPLGASRFYFTDEEWQDKVKGLLQDAQLVVIKPGISKNLEWEIEVANELCPPQKLLFPLLDYQSMSSAERQRQYGNFRKLLKKRMMVSLPEEFETALFLHLGPDKSPRFAYPNNWAYRLYQGRLWRILGDGTPLIIRETLRSILKERGIRFGKLRVARDMLVAFFDNFFVILLLLLFGTSLFYIRSKLVK